MSSYSDEELGAFLPGLFKAVSRLDPTTSAAKKTLAQFDPSAANSKYGGVVKGVLITAAAVGAGILTAGIAAGPIAAVGMTSVAGASVTALSTAGVTSLVSGVEKATKKPAPSFLATKASQTGETFITEPSVSASSTSASVGTKQFWDQTLAKAGAFSKTDNITTTVAIASAGVLLLVLVAAVSKRKAA